MLRSAFTASKSSLEAMPVSAIFLESFSVTASISVASEKLIVAFEMVGSSLTESLRSFTTSTTVSIAAAKASALLPPAPSTADAMAFTVVITCWEIFSTARATTGSTSAA